MKLTPSPLVAIAIAAFVLIENVYSQASPYRLRVEQVTKSDSEKHSKSQQRSLKIHVSNSSKEPAEMLAKYVFFGRDVKGNDVVKLDEGEKAVSVGGFATAMVESAVASSSYTEEHKTGGSSKGGKGGGGGSKKVEASGNKFIGYGVQLFKGETMIAEYYDPPSGKEQWTKASLAKPAAAASPEKKPVKK